jgi:hypothetical protein
MERIDGDSGSDPFPTADSSVDSDIGARYRRLRSRIAEAAQIHGRDPDSIHIVAVTKFQPAESIANAIAAGVADFGENYVQEALRKQVALSAREIRWHLIGHLQTNKAHTAAGRFSLIHSVDSARVAARISRESEALGLAQDILIQLKLGDEETKSGVAPRDLWPLVETVAALPCVRLRGLMAIAPLAENGMPARDSRAWFDEARKLFDRLAPEHRHVLSMGMSADFLDAIAAGATMVRIGSLLFGPRRAPTADPVAP